jgi:hypothetical protein
MHFGSAGLQYRGGQHEQTRPVCLPQKSVQKIQIKQIAKRRRHFALVVVGHQIQLGLQSVDATETSALGHRPNFSHIRQLGALHRVKASNKLASEGFVIDWKETKKKEKKKKIKKNDNQNECKSPYQDSLRTKPLRTGSRFLQNHAPLTSVEFEKSLEKQESAQIIKKNRCTQLFGTE